MCLGGDFILHVEALVCYVSSRMIKTRIELESHPPSFPSVHRSPAPHHARQPSFPDPSSLSRFRRKLAPFPDTILPPPSSLLPLHPVHHSPPPARHVVTPLADLFSLFPFSSLLPDHSPVFFLLLTPPFCICDCCNFYNGWSDAQVMKLTQKSPRLLRAKDISDSDVRENIMHLPVILNWVSHATLDYIRMHFM
ncbi:hypothetical protein C4D60_Mb10t00840 [Musa balbisiana]|uniref:Uncharacterized protein n=1 Tax=Musa balbisiana TaxID=52838 RepID=A0A4S8ITP6_MUSBA|nr:hypothetical protein C4D60_Mb10t00840 [Musa balbisiana]